MKKILRVLPLFFVFLLGGCQNVDFGCIFNPDKEGCVDGTLDYGDVTLNQAFNIIDISTEYTFSNTSLNVYKNDVNLDIYYVNIYEFLVGFHEGLLMYATDNSDDLTITFKYPVFDSGVTYYDIIIEFNADDNIIYMSDFRMSSLINADGTTEYEPNYELVNSDVRGLTTTKYLPVNNYGIDIIQMEDQFYIPLYLANFLLTGSMFELYQIEDDIYVFDDPNVLADVISGEYNMDLSRDIDEASMLYDTVNFTALVFDYYYGLKDEFGVERYRFEFSEYGLYSATDLIDYGEKFQEFILDLDDLHTGIYTLGYNQDHMDIIMPSADSRLGTFYDRYQANQCGVYDENVQLIENDRFYILKIYSFDIGLNTQLQAVLKDLDPDKDIVIDLSCNPGGSLGAVLDLLTYMTNNEFNLYYSNPGLGLVSTETYKTKYNGALKNDFFVYASNITFSAANLFVSMVKDNDLAIVLGQTTLGGACAVEYTVLPNNMIITYSSNFMMLNALEENIEYGVEPDEAYTEDIGALEAYFHYYKYFRSLVNLDVENTSDVNTIDFEVDLDIIDEDFHLDKYVITINTTNNKTLYRTEEITQEDFDFYLEMDRTYELVEIIVDCEYYYREEFRSEEILHVYYDDMTDTINADTKSISVSIQYYSYFHSMDDVDYIKLTITQKDVYRIYYGDDVYDGHTLFNEQEKILATGNDFLLEPGVYYIKLNTVTVGRYLLKVMRLFDDCFDPVEITLQEGYNFGDLHFDYDYDHETLIFTLEEDAVIIMEAGMVDGGVAFDITYLDGTRISDDNYYFSSNTFKDYELKLRKGTYMIDIDDFKGTDGDLGIQFMVDYSGDDYLDDFIVGVSNYGVLSDGDNTIIYEGMFDQDVYTLVLENDAHVELYANEDSDICILVDGLWQCSDNANYIGNLEAGTYYFKFIYNGRYYSGTDTIEVDIYG